jgi:hypothetical protein
VPGGLLVAVVDLLQADSGVGQHLLHRGGVRYGVLRLGVQRLQEHSSTAVCDARGHERLRILEPEQPGLYAHSSPEQVLAQLDGAELSLVGRHEVRQLGPPRHEHEATGRVGLDVLRRAERNRDAGTGRPHGPERRGARLGGQGLSAMLVVGMEVEYPGARLHGLAPLGGELLRGPRYRGVLFVCSAAVQGGLEERLHPAIEPVALMSRRP